MIGSRWISQEGKGGARGLESMVQPYSQAGVCPGFPAACNSEDVIRGPEFTLQVCMADKDCFSDAQEGTPGRCMAKPVHGNMVSSFLCMSLRWGCGGVKVNATCEAGLCVPVGACTYTYWGCGCSWGGGGAAGKNTHFTPRSLVTWPCTGKRRDTEPDHN